MDTERLREFQESLRTIEDPFSLLEALFAYSPTGLQIFRSDGRCLLVNKAFQDIFGIEPPPGYNIFKDDAVPAGFLDLVRRAFAGEVVRPATDWYDPCRSENASAAEGRCMALSIILFPLANRDGRIEHVVIAYQNQTPEQLARDAAEAERDKLRATVEKKEKAEEDLEQAEAHLTALVEKMPAILWSVDRDLRATSSFGSGLMSLSLKQGQMVGTDLYTYFNTTDPEHLPIAMHLRALKGEAIDYEYAWKGRDFLTHLDPIRDSSGAVTGVIGVAYDVTDRRRLESLILQTEKMSAVGQLAAGVAQEISNPLGAILGVAQSALRQASPSDPQRDAFSSIEREAQRCRDLIQDLLAYARTPITPLEPVNLNQAVVGALSLVEAQARALHVKVIRNLAPSLPPILGNAAQLQKSVIHLASNAYDAMPEGGTLTVTTESREDVMSVVLLRVSDTGAGIPPERLSRIFDPFFTTKAPGKGTGLGLSLVYEIVKRHSGHIQVESRPGLTEFTIAFPV